jgi:hypothetical protein
MRRTMEDKKQELVEGLITARRSVLEAVRPLPVGSLDQVFLGTWTIKDLLAHLVGWDETNVQAIQEIQAGQYPTFFQFYDKDWQTYNSRLVERCRKEPFSSLLAEVERTHQVLIEFLASIPAREVVQGKGRSETGRTISIRTLLRAETRDERIHAEQVQAFQLQIEQEKPGG